MAKTATATALRTPGKCPDMSDIPSARHCCPDPRPYVCLLSDDAGDEDRDMGEKNVTDTHAQIGFGHRDTPDDGHADRSHGRSAHPRFMVDLS